MFSSKFTSDAKNELKKDFNNKIPEFLLKYNPKENLIGKMIFGTLFLFIIGLGGILLTILIDIFNIMYFIGLFLLFFIAFRFLKKRLKLIYRSIEFG